MGLKCALGMASGRRIAPGSGLIRWVSSVPLAGHARDLEVAQVIHEARAASAIVVTYDPDRCIGHCIDVVDLRP